MKYLKTKNPLHKPTASKLFFSLKKNPLSINSELVLTVKVHKHALSVMLRHVLSLVAACSVRRYTGVEDTEIKSEKEKKKSVLTQTCRQSQIQHYTNAQTLTRSLYQ